MVPFHLLCVHSVVCDYALMDSRLAREYLRRWHPDTNPVLAQVKTKDRRWTWYDLTCWVSANTLARRRAEHHFCLFYSYLFSFCEENYNLSSPKLCLCHGRQSMPAHVKNIWPNSHFWVFMLAMPKTPKAPPFVFEGAFFGRFFADQYGNPNLNCKKMDGIFGIVHTFHIIFARCVHVVPL